MDKKKSQLNVQIDPKLLFALKSEAIKSGKTLTAFVTERLIQSPVQAKDDILELRLRKIEEELDLLKKFMQNSKFEDHQNISIFSDYGAKKYGEVARDLFELHRQKKKISLDDAFKELSKILAKYDGAVPELVFALLDGSHVLTGIEMTNAYRNGSCAMRSALTEWSRNTLEPLNEAFLNAVEVNNLL